MLFTNASCTATPSVQKGTFDSRHGEYEYVRNGEVDGTKHNRRKFVL